MSRPLIEFTTRRCTERHRNIVIRERCRVLQLAASGDGAAVTALRCTNGDGRVETIAADLVVDASGRAGLTQGLLEAIGRPPPRETVIGVGICYATAVFAMTADPPGDWKGVMTFDAAHEGGLAGIMLPLEGGRAIVTLAGRHGDKPPADHDGFLAYARELRTPTIHAAIRESEPQGEVARFGFPASIRRHFEEIEELPRGLLPFGDSLCRFNPVWGQGMSVAAQEAALLRALLDGRSGEADPLAGLAAEFSVGAARLIDTPWALAAVPDLADPRTDGQRPADLQQRLEYSQALNRLAAEDPAVHKLQYEVLHLLKPHHALSDPEIAERVSAAAAAAPDHSTR